MTPQPPGLLTRLFALIALIKLKRGYTDVIGADLGIIGAEDAGSKATPKFTADVDAGERQPDRDATVSLSTAMKAVYMESRRGTGGSPRSSGGDEAWQQAQVGAYGQLADGYVRR